MTIYNQRTKESIDFDDRDARGLTEHLTLVPKPGAEDVVEAVGESGATYVIDETSASCTCPDHEYRDVRCKHLRRWEFATGRRDVPEWLDESAISQPFGEFVDDVQVAADGGRDHEHEHEDVQDDTCDCDELDGDLECWECFNEARLDEAGIDVDRDEDGRRVATDGGLSTDEIIEADDVDGVRARLNEVLAEVYTLDGLLVAPLSLHDAIADLEETAATYALLADTTDGVAGQAEDEDE